MLCVQGAHQCPLQPVFRLEKPPADALVFSMAAGAATICHGTLELPRGSYLVCNESCMQLTFQDVTFRGAGLECGITLPHCAVRNYSPESRNVAGTLQRT